MNGTGLELYRQAFHRLALLCTQGLPFGADLAELSAAIAEWEETEGGAVPRLDLPVRWQVYRVRRSCGEVIREAEAGLGFAFAGEKLLHQSLFMGLKGFEFFALGGDEIVEGAEEPTVTVHHGERHVLHPLSPLEGIGRRAPRHHAPVVIAPLRVRHA